MNAPDRYEKFVVPEGVQKCAPHERVYQDAVVLRRLTQIARPEVKLAGAPPAAAPRPRRSRAAFLVADASLGQGRLSHAQPEDLP